MTRDVIKNRGHSLRGGLAQFDVGPDFQEQVDTDQQSVPNVEQTWRNNN